MRPARRDPSPAMTAPVRWISSIIARLERWLGLTPRHSSPSPTAPAVFEKAMTSGLRILVADDNPLNLEEACELLKRLGVAPKLAVDGVQAVALARQQDFDLILMDLQMPLLDGLGATKQIRDHEHTRSRARVPVLAYTSHALEDGLLRDCGVDGVLHKPCSESALQECVIRWCGAGSGTPFGAAATADMPSPR